MDSQLYVRNHLGSAWVRVAQNATGGPSGFRDARVLFDGTLVALGPQLEMYVYDPKAPGGAWSLVPNSQSAGSVANVSLGVHSVTQLPDGTLVGVGYDAQLYTMQSLGEPWVNSNPDHIWCWKAYAIPNSDRLVCTNPDGNWFSGTMDVAPWPEVPEAISCQSFTVLPDGGVLGIGVDDFMLYAKESLDADFQFWEDPHMMQSIGYVFESDAQRLFPELYI